MLPLQGVRVLSLVRELRSGMPLSQKKRGGIEKFETVIRER